MQFVESSVIGLRAARHQLSSSKFAHKITLLPMVHVGEASFYDDVYEDAARHDIVLTEGVEGSQIVMNITRSYRWLRLKQLGLVVQPKFDANITSGEVVRADLTANEFDRLWKNMPLMLRITFTALFPLYGLIRGLTLTKAALAEGMSTDMLTTRVDLLSWGDEFQPFRNVVMNARDEYLCACLSDLVHSSGKDMKKIAVVYGAAHMPAVFRHLNDLGGYVPVDSRWRTVFSVD